MAIAWFGQIGLAVRTYIGIAKANCVKQVATDASQENQLSDTQALLRAWRMLLPTEVCVSAGPIIATAPRLTKREQSSAGPVNEARLRELESGRAYAKRALAMIGFHDVELPIAPDRSPMWPPGVVGSLTHVTGPDGGHIAAAVARAPAVCAIGIDAEREGWLDPTTWEYFLTPREHQRIRSLPVAIRPLEAQIVWCAKETMIKAASQSIEPTELEIDRDVNECGYPGIWRATIVGPSHSARVWEGRTVRSQGFVLAAVVFQRDH